MEKERELLLKIELLEKENQNLSDMLSCKETDFPDNFTGFILNNEFTTNEMRKLKLSSVKDIENEKYISNLSKNLNVQVTECDVLNTVLREIYWRSSSRAIYYIQPGETIPDTFWYINKSVAEILFSFPVMSMAIMPAISSFRITGISSRLSVAG